MSQERRKNSQTQGAKEFKIAGQAAGVLGEAVFCKSFLSPSHAMKTGFIPTTVALSGFVLFFGCDQKRESTANVRVEKSTEASYSAGSVKIDGNKASNKLVGTDSNQVNSILKSIDSLQKSGVDSSDVNLLLSQYRNLLNSNPTEAVRQASELPSGTIRSRVLTLILSECPIADLNRVIAILADNGFPEDASAIKNANWQGKYTVELYQVLIKSSAGLVSADFRAAVIERAAEVYYATVASTPHSHDLSSVVSNLPQGLNDDDKTVFLSRYLTDMLVRDTRSASETLLKGVPLMNEENNKRFLRSAVKVLASVDNEYAGSWLQRASDKYPEVAGDLYYAYAESWLNVNSKRASEWVSLQPQGERKDYAILALLKYMRGKNIKDGVDIWINMLSSEEMRARVK